MLNEVGKSVSYTKSFNNDDLSVFAKISGDNNLIHMDEDYASNSIFKQRIVHGVLVASLFSTVFGTVYPGLGSIYLSQTLKFLKPVYLDQKITATVTLLSFDEQKNRGIFKTECWSDREELVLVGEAKILFP